MTLPPPAHGFRCHLRVTRPAGGSQEGRTGAYVTVGAPLVLYDGPADYQDQPVTRRAATDGAREVVADGRCYLPWTPDALAAVRTITVDDVVTLRHPDGREEEARVRQVRELDVRLDLARARVDR